MHSMVESISKCPLSKLRTTTETFNFNFNLLCVNANICFGR